MTLAPTIVKSFDAISHLSALPSVSVPYDRFELVVTRDPIQGFEAAAGLRHQRRRIAYSSRAQPHIEVGACDLLHGFNHLEHRQTAAVATVKYQIPPASAQMLESSEVGSDQIGNVDVVADASS